MARTVKARHVVTGIVVEIPEEQFAAMAFTPLGAVYDVLPEDYDAGCTDCGDPTEPEDEVLVSSEDDEDYYSYDEEEDSK